nr:uncharacterized protein LOC105844248 [Hydra vulgaris]
MVNVRKGEFDTFEEETNKKILALEDLVKKLLSKNLDLEKQLKFLEDNQAQIISKNNQINSKPLFSSLFHNKSLEPEETRILTAISAENKEKSRREYNLILHGLDELNKSTEENTQRENEQIKKIFNYLKVDESFIKRHHRLKSKTDKPGIVLVELNNKEKVADILKSASNLKYNVEYKKKVYINQDLTFAQRESRKLLLKEKNRLNNADNNQPFRVNKNKSDIIFPFNKKSNYLKFWYTNSTSLVNKITEFKTKIMIDSPDIILISETWFKNDLIINISNYNCFYNNRTNKQGGGVAIFTKYDIIAYEVSVSPLYKEVKQIWCSIVLHKTKILVGCIYRPPNSTDLINNAINELIKTAKKEVLNGKYSNVIIVGDFNYPNIIWNEDGTIELKQNCQTSKAFINNLQNNYLHQVVNKPTFQMAVDKPANILDLIICDDLDLIINIEYDAPLGQITKSHYILKWEINILNSYEKKFNNKRFNFRNGKYKEMNLIFYKVNWVEIFDKMNTNQCYKYFLKIYEKACKQYIPCHFKPTSSIKNPCINKKIKNLVRKKRSLWCRVRATNFKNTNLNNEYKLINKTIKKQIKKSTFDYEINLAKDVKHNPKRFYAYAQIKNQTHTKLLALKTSNNKIITDKKSLGCDNISPYVLKHCAEGLSKPLSLIFKKSIHSGELPELWKSANITPLFKKGNKKDPLNYRPISLTSIPSKIIEKIIRKKLIIYITENNLLTSQQHGFIQNKGCLTNLLETFDIITTEIENGYPVDIVPRFGKGVR